MSTDTNRLACITVVLLGAGCSLPAVSASAVPPTSPLGITWASSGGRGLLTRLLPLSLRPRGRPVSVPEYHDAWSFSPDRSQLALAISAPAKRGRVGIRIVDGARMRVRKDVVTGIAAEALAWLTPDRLVAVLQSGEVVMVDPPSGEIVQRWDLSDGARFHTVRSARTRHLFVAVLAGYTRPRPARLVVVDREGQLRSTLLGRIHVGERRARNNQVVPELAGVALDASGERAFVVGSKGPLAEIDLRTMQPRYHSLRRRDAGGRSNGRRVGSERRALWLGRGRIAVFGRDWVASGRRGLESVPSGATVVSTDTWTEQQIARRASAARIAAGRLLVYTPTAAPNEPGAGLGIHTLAGRPLHHLFARRTLDVEVAGRYAYAIGEHALRVVDVRSGQVVHETTRPAGIAELDLLPQAN